MNGLKTFVLKGDLVQLAVAFIMGTAFAAVVTTFTAVITDLIAKILGGNPDFNGWRPGGIHVGAFVTALIAFLIMATVLYLFVVVPYNRAKQRYFPDEVAPEDPQLVVLREIRDELATR
jgi:large conductance mechanosensitive channel